MGVHAFTPRELQGSGNSGSSAPSERLGALMHTERPSWGVGDTERVPRPRAGSVATVWQFISCVSELQSSLCSLPPWQVLTCVLSAASFHWKLPVTGGDMAACQRQLVDIKLIYTFRIILYD